jgi:hypothetical protein
VSTSFVVRYEMRPETADENQRLVEAVFAELTRTRPEGLRYAAFRLADGVTFVHVGTAPDEGDPLGGTAAFAEFQKEFGQRAVARPDASGAVMVGSYGFDR